MTWVRAYAQLVRFPNVFTAFADICLGGLAAGILTSNATISAWTAFALLLAASGSLYCAGMVWNDYFDLERIAESVRFGRFPRVE